MNWIAWAAGFGSIGFIILLALFTNLLWRVKHLEYEIDWLNEHNAADRLEWRDLYRRLDDHGYRLIQLQSDMKKADK